MSAEILTAAGFLEFLNPENLLEALGTYALVGVVLIIFAECGLLIGFFLPGDSLLFATGMFIAQGFIPVNIWWACVLLTAAAFLGNVVGYWVGAKAGPRLFARQDSRIFKQEYVDKTQAFFDKYGNRAIVMARFVPIVRTFITAMAGVGRMDYRRYLIYSGIGALIWGTGVTLLGYFLGSIPFVKDNVEIMLLAIVLVSAVPMVWEYVKHRRERAAGPAAATVGADAE